MTKRLRMAKRITHATNFKIANGGNTMTRKQIDRQINLQKMHNARTVRAKKNNIEYHRLYKAYGGMYTQSELNTISDLYPGLAEAYENRPAEQDIDAVDIAEILEQLQMFINITQEDNYLMA